MEEQAGAGEEDRGLEEDQQERSQQEPGLVDQEEEPLEVTHGHVAEEGDIRTTLIDHLDVCTLVGLAVCSTCEAAVTAVARTPPAGWRSRAG